MKPGRLALTIVQGATFRRRFVWKAPAPPGSVLEPVDLTGYAARSQVRVDGNAVLTFDSDPATAPDGSLTLGADGSIELRADADVVSAAPAGSGSWSLEIQPPGGDRVVLLMGDVTILREITL